jgi:hypothetical protein
VVAGLGQLLADQAHGHRIGRCAQAPSVAVSAAPRLRTAARLAAAGLPVIHGVHNVHPDQARH